MFFCPIPLRLSPLDPIQHRRGQTTGNYAARTSLDQGKSPGLLQHVPTVLVFWSWVLLLPGFDLGLGASDCSPGLAFSSTGPWTLLGSAARSSPTIRAKTGRTAHVFTARGGTRQSNVGESSRGNTIRGSQNL